MNEELLRLAETLADEIDKEAEVRRTRAMYAATECDSVTSEETDRWRVAFSTSYQTLRGIAAALRATVACEKA